MAPVQPRKRKSDSSVATTPQRSPIKKRKMGISIAQKQALIDNLQLEITERARRLRAQYNVQAQQLRSRVEMRVNRIPTALRRAKMGELFSKSIQSQQQQQQQQQQRPPKDPYVAKPPPVPAKDATSPMRIARKPVPPSKPTSGRKRLRYAVDHVCAATELTITSDEIAGADKENQGGPVENSKKKMRGGPAKEAPVVQPGQVLSTTSSNTRVLPRDRPQSPTKSVVSRPASPTKGPTVKPSSSMLSNMVEKAKGSRSAAAVARKGTSSSTASSNPGTATAAGRARKAAAPGPPPTAATRGRRKGSGVSESSEGSTTNTAKKGAASKAAKPAPAAKRTVMSTIKSATTKKAPATAAPKAAGRTLRKRAP